MRTFSSLLVSVCAAAALTAHGTGHEITAPRAAAQEVTITAADKATYQEFLSACAQPIATMKAVVASHGDTVTDAQVRDMFIAMPAVFREQATEEKMTFVERVRMARADFKKEAEDPNSTDPSNKVLAPSMLCWLDLLIATETGGPKPQRPPSSSAPAPVARETAEAVDCVTVDFGAGVRGQAALLRNKCAHQVYVAVCFTNVTAGSTTEAIACERGVFEVWRIEARAAEMLDMTDGDRYFWRACQPPFLPRIWWDATKTGDARSQGICEKR